MVKRNRTAYMRVYREKNREKFREYNRFYNKVWRWKNGYEAEIKSQEKYPERVRARKLLQKAVEKGIIKRGPCEVCGKPNGQAHHDSYEMGKELQVGWFCALHHREHEVSLGKLNGSHGDEPHPHSVI